MYTNSLITKSDYLKYRECPSYFWFSKKKSSVLSNQELSEFQRELILNGAEVEGWARKMFPKGVLVESFHDDAVAETKKLINEGEKYLFQATFEKDGIYAMVDILVWDEEKQYWIINEVKASSSKQEKKEQFIYDASFQYLLLNQVGLKVGRVNLIELNKEFRKKGDIIARDLLETTDITDKAIELEAEITEQILDMKRLLGEDTEPHTCDCIYKSRSNHCPAFAYLHPGVPDYSVHDIVRIGNSPKRLEGLIEEGYLKIQDVPEDYKLTDLQRNHVNVEQDQIPIINKFEIKKQIDELEYPLYFLDYETLPSAVPIYDGCRPYQQVPFQYSLHVQECMGADLEHYEFLHTCEESHPMQKLAKSLMSHIGDSGNIIVWNKKFEAKCHEDMAELMPEFAEIFLGYNERFFDLMEIFAKQLYLHPDFRGGYSIKVVLPVLVPGLSYNGLNVSDGAMAMNAWKKMMFNCDDEAEKKQIDKDLLEYCELDTLAMYEILEVLRGL